MTPFTVGASRSEPLRPCSGGDRLGRARSALRLIPLLLAAGLAGCNSVPAVKEGGAACTQTTDCAFGLVCTNKICTPGNTICTPGAKTCEGSSVVVCAADGLDLVQETSCAAGCQSGACIQQICTPGTSRCSGNGVTTCSADGTQYNPVSICPLGCDATTAACIAAVCRPGATTCTADGQLSTCKTDGSGVTTTSCGPAASATCTTNGLSGSASVAFCQTQTCTPGAVSCSGLEILQCNAAGTGQVGITSCAHACSSGACVEATCSPGSTQCSIDGTSVQTCNALGTGFDTTTCVVNGSGSCALAPGSTGPLAARCISTLCVPNAFRCNGETRLQCSADGLSETTVATCMYGCSATLGCEQPACAPGQQICSGNALETCAPNQQSYILNQYCLAGCTATGTTATCATPICAPFSATCTADNTGIQFCTADGTGYTTTPCATGLTCANGACVEPPSACVQNSVQCYAGLLQTCTSVNNGPLGYTPFGECLGQCSNNACDSAGACTAFNLSIALVPAGVSLPADGQSSFLVVSDPILSPGGVPVPDGTFVTVGAMGAALLSADADPTTPGLQIEVVAGRIDFLIEAPLLTSGTQSAQISAQIGSLSLCSGSLQVTFDPTVTDQYVGEDFTTTRARAVESPISQWDTARGVLTLNQFDAGDGRDGDLIVVPGQSVDLSQRMSNGHSFADMASSALADAEGSRLAVAGDFTPFQQPGTRLLVINLQGQPNQVSAVGAYEYATVTGTANGYLTLAQPLTRIYGAGGNTAAQLAGQLVRVIRVPQYQRIIIGGTVTGPAFNGTQGGVLAFFAASTLSVAQGGSQLYGNGTITMAGLGYRGGSQPPMAQAGLSGEGLEGSLNTNTTVGSVGVSGGGYCCDDRPGISGDIVPVTMPTATTAAACPPPCLQHLAGVPLPASCPDACLNPKTVVTPGQAPPADIATASYFGSSGSYATVGQSSCASYGPGSVYGDQLLQNAFLGGGAGSVSRSSAHSCYNATQRCCRRTDPGNYGFCCSDADAACVGCIDTPYCDAISYLWDQSYPGAPGGGIILVTAAALELDDLSVIDARGAMAPAGPFGGAGGTVYLRAENLALTSVGRLLAGGGGGGGDGRVRIDAVNIDASFGATWTTPSATYVPAAADTVLSTTVLMLPNAGYTTASSIMLPAATSIPVLNGAFDPVGSLAATDLTLALTQDLVTFGQVDTGGLIAFGQPGQAALGTTVEWLVGPAAPVGSTRGVAVHFVQQ